MKKLCLLADFDQRLLVLVDSQHDGRELRLHRGSHIDIIEHALYPLATATAEYMTLSVHGHEGLPYLRSSTRAAASKSSCAAELISLSLLVFLHTTYNL